MPSEALRSFTNAVGEIGDLFVAVAPSLSATASTALKVTRAIGRAQVVLLSAHFERYFYGVNEEAIYFLNSRRLAAATFSERFRLLHSKLPIDELGEMDWERRGAHLTTFISEDGWLWSHSETGTLLHDRLLAWLRSPKPSDLIRYYRYWDIDDIFSKITRKPGARGRLWLGVQEFVDMRNNIAHGDFAAQPTQSDIRRYIRSANTFCERADRQLSSVLSQLTQSERPW